MRIAIGGDSFAYGSWGNKNGIYQSVHQGLAQYLCEDGHRTSICGKSGGGFYGSFYRLDLHVTKSVHKPDLIIFFVTDCYRRDDLPIEEIYSLPLSPANLLAHRDTRKRQLFEKINALDIPCILIGALTGVQESDIIGLSNLSIGTNNMFKLVLPDFVGWELYYRGLVDYIVTPENANEETLAFIEEQERRFDFLSKTEWLGNEYAPDDSHPSPHAFRVLHDHLNLGKGDYDGMTPKEFKKDVYSKLEIDYIKKDFQTGAFHHYQIETGDTSTKFDDWLVLNIERLDRTWNTIIEANKGRRPGNAGLKPYHDFKNNKGK